LSQAMSRKRCGMDESDTWTEARFFAEAEKESAPEVVASLRRVFTFFEDRGDPVKWGPARNKNGGFQFGIRGVSQSPIVFGYIDGCVGIYTSKLSDPKQVKLRRRLESQLRTIVAERVDNEQHYQVRLDDPSVSADEFISNLSDALGED
jgi:hypothetical protein